MEYEFTEDWVTNNLPLFNKVINTYKPENILEIGCFEGRSTVYWATRPSTKHVYCIDSWAGSWYTTIEKRFDHNISDLTNVTKIKEPSISALSTMQKEFQGKIDLIYIDGSHDPRTTLVDAVLAFNLCKSGGIMIFDDYLLISFTSYDDIIKQGNPKIAIDAFTNIFQHDIHIFHCKYQLGLRKL